MTAPVLIITPALPQELTQAAGTVPLQARTAEEFTDSEWDEAPLIVVDRRSCADLMQRQQPRRPGILVLAQDLADASVYSEVVALHAEAVLTLQDGAAWLELRLHEATGCTHLNWERLLGDGPGGVTSPA
ncbi:hypothetical protein SLUN_00090 [Streptomyces lunaelactis]|uniref:Rv3660c-like CheY-like N-terminal domain-containing protein n=1 Tax=Streptomyces lunaelactis TaxID=1535768 RepID=A0A2R4SVM1_9ACTN|nr:hypothetical protein [Streptomyces lunaelactis]AVZ70904.1 hypothetical protein SLUN_00090 [Streptomyces lunaelactis]NUK26914.1 hypothetical protein [Streptomyces lunaelactis]NUK85629.1 hypothetical protein [Streptomyces lunaelactis]